MHICTLLKVRFFFFFFFLNHETKNKCKRVTVPWKSTNLYCVHIFHTMKWKYVHLSDRLPLIDCATLWHGLDKCVCMCLIDDLKLNHGRIWFYIVHQILSLLIYPKQKLSNQITQTEIIFKPLNLKGEREKKNRRGFSVLMVVGGLYNKGNDPLDSSFSLFQMFCQSQVFLFW